MTNPAATDKEKQFTVLPDETDPKMAVGKANQAIQKALLDIKKSKRLKGSKP